MKLIMIMSSSQFCITNQQMLTRYSNKTVHFVVTAIN